MVISLEVIFSHLTHLLQGHRGHYYTTVFFHSVVIPMISKLTFLCEISQGRVLYSEILALKMCVPMDKCENFNLD